MRDKGTLLVLTGPTASGKSALAIEVARRLDTEIVSADSRQIYRGIPVATAAPTAEERAAVGHHLVEVLPLEAYYSAAIYEEDALAICRRLMAERGVAVVCGGSMMYVDALCHGIDALPTVPDEIRAGLREKHLAQGDEWLRRELHRLDPGYYERVDLANVKRVFHAVELSLTAGRPYSSLLTGERRRREFDIVKVMLNAERSVLFDRINSRVDRMVVAGLEEEARRVYPLRHLNSLNTVGLKEMFAWFDGEMERPVAIERIKKNTRVYAKKQLTWFKRDAELQVVDIESGLMADRVLDFMVKAR